VLATVAGVSIFASSSAPARADIWDQFFGTLTQSFFAPIQQWVNQVIPGLTSGALGIFDPNLARQQVYASGQATNEYEQNDVENTLARALAEGTLSDVAQSTAQQNIQITDTNVDTGAAAASTVQSLAAQASTITDTQDLVRLLVQQNAELASQQQQVLEITAQAHIHNIVSQSSMGALAVTSANTARAADRANISWDMGRYSYAADAVYVQSQTLLSP